MAADGVKAANLKQAYVSHSRFEESNMTYAYDMITAMKAMARCAERMLAIEAVGKRIRRWKIFAKLSQKYEDWIRSQKKLLDTRQAQRSEIRGGVYAQT